MKSLCEVQRVYRKGNSFTCIYTSKPYNIQADFKWKHRQLLMNVQLLLMVNVVNASETFLRVLYL